MQARPSSHPTPRPAARHRALKALFAVLILVGLFLTFLPHGLSYVLKRGLMAAGAERVELGDVDFNALTGWFLVRDLVVTRADRQPLRIPRASVRFSWGPLWQRRVRIHRIVIWDTSLTIERLAEAVLRLGGVTLGTAEAAAGEDSETKPWGISLGALEIRDSSILYIEPEIEASLRVQRLELARVSTWDKTSPARLSVKGHLDGTPVELNGELALFSEEPYFKGRLEVGGLILERYAAAARPAAAKLRGTLHADLEIAAHRRTAGHIELYQQGVVRAEGLRTDSALGQLDGEQLRWRGVTHANLPLGAGPIELSATGYVDTSTLRLKQPEAGLELRSKKLAWSGKVQVKAAAGSPTELRLSENGLIRAAGVRVRSPFSDIQDERIRWRGTTELLIRPESELPEVIVEGELQRGRLALTMVDTPVKFAHAGMRWQGKLSINQDLPDDTSLQISHEGKVVVTDARLETAQGTMIDPKLAWDGATKLTLSKASATPNVQLRGKLDQGPLRLSLPQQEGQLEHSGLTWEGQIQLGPGVDEDTSGMRVQQGGSLAIEDLVVRTADGELSHERIEWDGTTLTELRPDRPGPLVETDGSLHIAATNIVMPQQRLRLRHDGLQWKGVTRYGQGDPAADFHVGGDLAWTRPTIEDTDLGLTLLSTEALELQEIRMEGVESVGIARVHVKDVYAAKRLRRPESPKTAGNAPLLRATTIDAENVELRNLRLLGVDTLRLQDAEVVMRRDRNARFPLLEDVLSSRQGPTEEVRVASAEASPATEEADPTVVRLGLVELAGDSLVRFEDESVSPAFRKALRFSQARIERLDSSQPEQESPLTVVAQVGDYSQLALRGYVKPFGQRLTLDLTGKLEQLELPPLSPYAARQLGYNLKSGDLDADFDLKIIEGELQGDTKLLVRNLELEPDDATKMAQLSKQLTVPLDTALSMLRNKRNDIKLTVPLRGDISDPKFDVSDAINQAIGKAMKSAAVSYLKYALGPYGALITVAELAGKAGKMATAVKLQPVLYGTAEAELDATAKDYLEHLAKLLQQRPELRIKLCGIATESDRATLTQTLAPAPATTEDSALQAAAAEPTVPAEAKTQTPPIVPDEQLLELAEQRARGIKDRLVKERGIQSKRLFICNPRIDLESDAKPRVEPLI